MAYQLSLFSSSLGCSLLISCYIRRDHWKIYWLGSFFPADAFGEQGREAKNGFQAIPSNVVLTIDVELVSLKPVVDVSGDLKVLKKVLRSGEGIHRPKDGEAVRGKCLHL